MQREEPPPYYYSIKYSGTGAAVVWWLSCGFGAHYHLVRPHIAKINFIVFLKSLGKWRTSSSHLNLWNLKLTINTVWKK